MRRRPDMSQMRSAQGEFGHLSVFLRQRSSDRYDHVVPSLEVRPTLLLVIVPLAPIPFSISSERQRQIEYMVYDIDTGQTSCHTGLFGRGKVEPLVRQATKNRICSVATRPCAAVPDVTSLLTSHGGATETDAACASGRSPTYTTVLCGYAAHQNLVARGIGHAMQSDARASRFFMRHLSL